MRKLQILDVSSDEHYIDFVWAPPTQVFFAYYIFQYKQNQRILIAQIPRYQTDDNGFVITDGSGYLVPRPDLAHHYRYAIPPEQKGAKITLGICAYNHDTNQLSEPALIVVATAPQSPSNAVVDEAYDNRVTLTWAHPSTINNGSLSPHIRGFRIARSDDGLNYIALGEVAGFKFTDIGNAHVPPSNQRHYYYQISALSWDGIASPPLTIRANVIERTIVDATMLVQKTMTSLPPGQYRIKAVGGQAETGESPWINLKNIRLSTTIAMPQFKITALSTNGALSYSVKSRTINVPYRSQIISNDSNMDLVNENGDVLCSDGGRYQNEVPRFRIRAVSTTGLESNAMIAQIFDMTSIKYIVNKEKEELHNLINHKMVNKRGGL